MTSRGEFAHARSREAHAVLMEDAQLPLVHRSRLVIDQRNDDLSVSMSGTLTAFISEVLPMDCHATVIENCSELATRRSDFLRLSTAPCKI